LKLDTGPRRSNRKSTLALLEGNGRSGRLRTRIGLRCKCSESFRAPSHFHHVAPALLVAAA